jgi:AP-4 complex subunit mu-1
LDSINFSEFVNIDDFSSSKTLSLYPPDGEFTVLNYRVLSEFPMPFKILPIIETPQKYKIEVIIKIRCDIDKENHGANVLIKVPIPKESSGVYVDFGTQTSSQNSYEYKQNENVILWGIKKFMGQTEQICRLRITTSEQVTDDLTKVIGPISLKFELPMHNVSGLNVRSLKIEEKSKVTPSRWVRYITQANSYIVRI